MLEEFLGIGEIANMMTALMNGTKNDIAIYPMGIPKQNHSAFHQLSALMIGKCWRKFDEVRLE